MSVISSQDATLRYDSPVEIVDSRHVTPGADLRVGQGPLLLWIAHGAVDLEWQSRHGNWDPLLLRAGDFYLFTSESVQLRRAQRCRSDFDGICLHISRNILSRIADGRGDAAAASHAPGTRGRADPTLRALLELLRRPQCPTTSLSLPFVEGVAQAVVAQLLSYPATAPSGSACHHHGLAPYKFRLVSRAMRERLTEPFDLEHLAGLAGLSTFHFSRAFKKASGMAPSRYFQRLRIEQAGRMLANDEQSIIDVAMAVGFRSPSHFSQVFREVTGVSPSAYRKRLTFMRKSAPAGARPAAPGPQTHAGT